MAGPAVLDDAAAEGVEERARGAVAVGAGAEVAGEAAGEVSTALEL